MNPGISGNGSPITDPPLPLLTHPELEKHIMDLSDEKSPLEQTLARTEWLIQGVRRSMDEMRERELAIVLSKRAAQSPRRPTPADHSRLFPLDPYTRPKDVLSLRRLFLYRGTDPQKPRPSKSAFDFPSDILPFRLLCSLLDPLFP